MAAVLIALYLLLIAPFQAGLLLQWENDRISINVGIMLWGVRKRFPFLLQKEENKWQMHFPFSRKQNRRKERKNLLLLLPRLYILRRKIFRFIRLRHLQMHALIALPDAGDTAMLCGILNALICPFSHHSRIVPSFSGQNRGWALCIVESRLGTILFAWLIWKIHAARHRKKEAHTWPIPSEP